MAPPMPPNKDPVLVVTNLDPRIKSKALQKIFGKHGKILKIVTGSAGGFRIEYNNPSDAAHALSKLNGKVVLDKKLAIAFETNSRGPSAKDKIKAIASKLEMLEQGIEHTDTVGRIKAPINSFIFNRDGKSTPIFNGLGTTRTKQSTTLFIANIPHEISNGPRFSDIMTAAFSGDPGFFGVRLVRAMCFVDFESIADATKSMVKHQNERLPGVGLQRMGLMIDYDKDSRQKRNNAYEKSRTT